MKRLLPRLTYANVVATLALFVALGGASYAATQLPKNSVGTKQLRNNAVTAAKIKKGAVTGEKILGSVPSATNAQHAATADSAANASALGGIAASDFATTNLVRTATIAADGTLDPERSVGITQANVLHKQTGVYCINGLSPAPKTAVGANTFGETIGTDVIASVENEPNCQTDISVYDGDSEDLKDEPFVVLLR